MLRDILLDSIFDFLKEINVYNKLYWFDFDKGYRPSWIVERLVIFDGIEGEVFDVEITCSVLI